MQSCHTGSEIQYKPHHVRTMDVDILASASVEMAVRMSSYPTRGVHGLASSNVNSVLCSVTD